jgi:hypothetical protein
LLAEQAAVEGAAADVIILSLHGHNELRAEARAWLSRWLHHKEDRPYGLAALLDPEPDQPGSDNPVVAYLRRVAATAGVELFCGSGQEPVPRRTQPFADATSAFCSERISRKPDTRSFEFPYTVHRGKQRRVECLAAVAARGESPQAGRI